MKDPGFVYRMHKNSPQQICVARTVVQIMDQSVADLPDDQRSEIQSKTLTLKSISLMDHNKLEKLDLRKLTMMNGTFTYCSPEGSEYLYTQTFGDVATPRDVDEYQITEPKEEPAVPEATGKKCPTEGVAEIASYSNDIIAF